MVSFMPLSINLWCFSTRWARVSPQKAQNHSNGWAKPKNVLGQVVDARTSKKVTIKSYGKKMNEIWFRWKNCFGSWSWSLLKIDKSLPLGLSWNVCNHRRKDAMSRTCFLPNFSIHKSHPKAAKYWTEDKREKGCVWDDESWKHAIFYVF